MAGRLCREIQTDAENFCSHTSTHGFRYFTRKHAVPARLFWLAISVVMFLYSGIYIRKSFQSWHDKPTATVIETMSYPVQNIQFPTVTICQSSDMDKFGFVRNVLDTLKFECFGEAECNETLAVRNLFMGIEYSTAKLVPFADGIADTFLHMITNEYNTADGKKWYPTKTFRIYPFVTRAYESCCGFAKLDIILKKKLNGEINNYGIYSYLNITKDSYYNKIVPANTATNSSILNLFHQETYKVVVVLGLPMPGQLGSLLASFANTFLNSTSVMTAQDTDWFNGPLMDSHEVINQKYLEDLFTMMTGNNNLGISPFDISAILSPVETYFNFVPITKQFPYTAYRQNIIHNFSSFDNSTNKTISEPVYPFFYLENNYLGKLLGPHLEAVMEVMLQSMLNTRPYSFKERVKMVSHLYQNLSYYVRFPYDLDYVPYRPQFQDFSLKNDSDTLPYFLDIVQRYFEFSQNPQYVPPPNTEEIMDELQKVYHRQQMIISCSGPGINSSCANDFRPVLTDNGICHAYNAMGSKDSFINNTYIQYFQNIYEAEGEGNNSTLVNNTGSGQSFQMFMVLNSHLSDVVENQPFFTGSFKVAINQLFDFSNVQQQYVDVKAGCYTNIRVTPTQYITTEAFREYGVMERNCRYLDENPNPISLFKFYTEKTCNFECRLKHARKQCGCTPWNYPQYGSASINEICDGLNAYCFETAMADNIKCDCMIDCEKVSFEQDMYSHNFDHNIECNWVVATYKSPQELNIALRLAEEMRNMEGGEYFRLFTGLYWYPGADGDRGDYFGQEMIDNNKFHKNSNAISSYNCINIVTSDYALLSIEVADPQIVRYSRDVSVDFVTKISLLGGTLGIFTGMSLMSIIEFGFWIIGIAILPFFAYSYTKGRTRKRTVEPSIQKQQWNNI